MRRSPVIAVALLWLTAGCGWLQTGFDSGRTRDNPLETAIGIGNVSSLVRHDVPLGTQADAPAQIVMGTRVLGAYGGVLAALDSTTCPAPGDAACPVTWSQPNAGAAHLATDGATIFSGGRVDGPASYERTLQLNATSLAGTPRWSANFPYAISTDNPFIDDVTVTGDSALLGVSELHHGTSYYARTLHVLPTAGCGTPTCSPSRSITTLGTANVATAGDTLIALVDATESGVPTTRIRAIDLHTGATRWKSAWHVTTDAVNPPAGSFIVRDGKVLWLRIGSGTVEAYGLDGTSCGGPCSPQLTVATRGLTLGSAYGPRLHIVTEGDRLEWLDADCRCSLASTLPGLPVRVWAVANGVLYASQGTKLMAFSSGATTGCAPLGPSSPPIVCSPVWSSTLPGEVRDALVWNGRVYVLAHSTTTGIETQHVFELPH